MSKRKKTSPVWDFFSKVDGKITCNVCKILLADGGGTSNLQKHLRGKHPEEARKAFGDSVDKKQSFMSCFRKCSVIHANKITELISEVVVRDLRPLSIVEDQGFKQLLNYIEPNYRVPSRPHITSICQKLYLSEKEKLLEKLQSRYVSLTSDLWTSHAIQAYLTVTVHFINEEWNMESYVLTTNEMPERHTG